MGAELIEKLKKLAGRKCWFDNDDFDANDYSGGNFGDAYQGGGKDGQAYLAREVLTYLGEEW